MSYTVHIRTSLSYEGNELQTYEYVGLYVGLIASTKQTVRCQRLNHAYL